MRNKMERKTDENIKIINKNSKKMDNKIDGLEKKIGEQIKKNKEAMGNKMGNKKEKISVFIEENKKNCWKNRRNSDNNI